jgi:GTP-dependent phosphoenolpyruvate carboxykinase
VAARVDFASDRKCVAELLEVNHDQWQKELAEHKKFFDSLGGVVPDKLMK